MMATKTLEIAIVGTNKSATKAFKEVDDAAGTTEGKLRQLGDSIGPAVTAAAAAVVAGVGFALKTAWSAAEESAKIGRETERVLQTTGSAAWTSADQVSALASSISEVTGADDELIQSGANLLLTFTNIQNKAGEGNDIFNQATQLALDMSTALGTDMSQASIQLGKALNDPIRGITALSRAGVSFTEDQKEQIKTLVSTGDLLGAQKIILNELSKEFGGAAEAAATPMDKLKVKLDNFAETVGTALMPIVGGAADVFSGLISSFEALPGPIKIAVELLGAGAAGIGGAVLLTSKIVSTFGDTLKPVMDFMRRQFDNAAISVGVMAEKMTGSADVGQKLASSMSSAVVPAIGGVMAAATLAFGVWTMYQQSQQEVDRRAKEFTATLDANTGAITANAAAFIEKTLTDRNQIDNLNQAGISLGMYTAAIADNSHKIALNRGEILDLAIGTHSSSEGRKQLIDTLRNEGGARNELIARLVEEKTLDAGLLDTILEQTTAYDKNVQKIADKVEMQALSTGKNREEAQAAAEAAAANIRHADSIKEVADELRAQTDPYFAAWRSQQALTEANANYDKVSKDSTKTDAEKKAAWIAAATAAAAFKGDILDLNIAQSKSGATGDALQGQLKDLSKFGLDTTGQSARGATYDLLALGNTAEVVGNAEVNIPVDLEMKKVKERLDWLKRQVNPDTGFVPLEALYALPFAKGGVVPDGMFITGEQGPELGIKQGDSVRIFSNPDSRRMLSPASMSTSGGTAGPPINVTINTVAGDPAAIERVVVDALGRAYVRGMTTLQP